jgi:hypothetical protein
VIRAVAVVLAAALAAPAVHAQPPAPGRHDAELCVAVGDAQPGCGPVQLRMQRSGALQVVVADMVYRLQLHSSQLDLVLMHGTMQIDGFTADYAWDGPTLTFTDPDKPVFYRLTVRAAKR